MEQLKKFTYPAVAITCCLILGAAFVIAQVNKQESIELQQLRKMQHEKDILEDEKKEKKALADKISQCLYAADSSYWSYVELNGTTKEDDTIRASQYVWDIAEENKQKAIDNCYKRYK